MIRLGRIDLLTAGFPCQPFSTGGLHLGGLDERSEVIVHIIRYIDTGLATSFLLENVEGLLTQHKEVLGWILNELKKAFNHGYWVSATSEMPKCSDLLFCHDININISSLINNR